MATVKGHEACNTIAIQRTRSKQTCVCFVFDSYVDLPATGWLKAPLLLFIAAVHAIHVQAEKRHYLWTDPFTIHSIHHRIDPGTYNTIDHYHKAPVLTG